MQLFFFNHACMHAHMHTHTHPTVAHVHVHSIMYDTITIHAQSHAIKGGDFYLTQPPTSIHSVTHTHTHTNSSSEDPLLREIKQ